MQEISVVYGVMFRLLTGMLLALVVSGLARADDDDTSKPFPAKLPLEKPRDRTLSAAMERLYDEWNPLGDRGNELFSNFKFTRLEGLSYQGNTSRRDPSKVLRIDGTYYVWYTRRQTDHPPTGPQNATETIPSYDWDLAEIWYATSKDGFHWEEQGPAVRRAPPGEYGWRSVSTPDVLAWGGKYYLYFQGFNEIPGRRGDRAAVTVAEAESPDGTWRALRRVVVDFGNEGDWDSAAIHDPYPLVYKGKIYLYYKGAPGKQGRGGTLVRAQGLAIADHPLGPFTKSPLNPVLNSGHETCLWPWQGGIAVIVSLDGPEKNTVQYAPDGVNFQMMSILQVPPIAPGPFVPDAFADNGAGRGITWGLCHINPDGGGATHESILARFDCDLSLDVDRPVFKRNNLRFNAETYFQRAVQLPDYLLKEIQRDREIVDRETKLGRIAEWSSVHAEDPPDIPAEYQRAIERKTDLAEKLIAQGPYRADFQDLRRHVEAPGWYRDAKFGIYFHWGVYSVPEAGNEWYPCNMHHAQDDRFEIHDHHVKTYGGPLQHPYDDFVSGLTAENFNADEWVDLFVQAGAKFAGPVAEHHDGYSMWDSDVTPWNAAQTGPRRDVTGELEKAVRRRGLKFITTFHHARNGVMPDAPNMRRHWHYAGALQHYPTLLADPQRAFLYGYMPRERFEQLWLAKLVEVIDAYQPDLIWFDSWLHSISAKRRAQFLAYYLNRAKEWDREVVITFKQDDLPSEIGLEDFERGRLNKLSQHCWLTDDTITAHRSWCYIRNLPLKTPAYLIHVLADIVSKNGCLLLNIAPRADGTIPDNQRQVLLELGAWLKINGEAIYATRPWRIFGEGPTRLEESGQFVEEVEYTSQDVRFTRSQDGQAIYVIALGRPPGQEITIQAMGTDRGLLTHRISSVEILGSPQEVEWRRDAESLHLGFPEKMADGYAFVWKLTLKQANNADRSADQPFPAAMPLQKPIDRPLSASWTRMWDRWNPHEDRGNELYSNFRYTPLKGLSREQPYVSRRDPTKVLKVDDTYYVWYTRRATEAPPAGLKGATDTIPATDWDLADIWYATSKDGFTWDEQGPAVRRPGKPTTGWRSICTPDVLVWKGKYYLYFQGYSPMVGGQRHCPVMVAVADSPVGPWWLMEQPVLEPGPPGSWDNIKINDPCLLVHQGKIRLYYKGAPIERGDQYVLRMQGMAMADDPLGPFTKSPLNPVINSGHETCIWPWRSGIAALVALDGPEKNTIQYAADGVNFEVASLVQLPPIAPGPFMPDAFADNGDGRGFTWGLCHLNPDGGGATSESILVRFDCDLSLDVDRPLFKRNNLRFERGTYFQSRLRLPDNLRHQIDRERHKVDRNTMLIPAAAGTSE